MLADKNLKCIKMFLLLSCWIFVGITAGDPPVVYYLLKNSSVCLHVRSPPPYKNNQWFLAETFIVSPGDRNPTFKGKVDFDRENSSLCIKELTDSGIYKFSFTDSEYLSQSEEHEIIVQEMVPRPVIEMSVLSSNLSAGICNISVNCSLQQDWLLSFCDEDRCRRSQTSLSKVNITVSTDNRTVVCSANNHVSANNVSESITTACFSQSNLESKEDSQPLFIIAIAITVCLFLFTFIIFVAKKLFLVKKHDQTSTIHLIQNQQAEAQTQPELRVSTSSSSQATYENVDAIRPSQTSSTAQELRSGQKVDTVYSVLQPSKKAPPPGNSDRSENTTPGHRKTQDQASTSQPVTAGEAEHPVQIDTVYSMLQKPKRLKPQHHL